MTENKNVPCIRFDGFNDAWEERKLKEVVEKQIKGKAQFEKLAQGDVEYLDTSRLNGGQAILTNGLKDVTLDDILILWDGSKAGTVYHGFEGALGSTLKAYRTSANSKFIYQYLKRHQDNIYNNYRTPNIPHVQKDFLNVFTISVPGSDEQAKIGSFFKKLDDTIVLHQRKVEVLQNLKKALLQRMFASKDNPIPDIRFAGFTDPWEQRKFEDCFNFPVSTNSLSRALLNYDNGKIINVHYGDVLIKYHSILNVKREIVPYITNGTLEAYRANLLENGDLIFADAAEDETVGKAVEVRGITNENLVSGLHTIVARPAEQKAEYFLGYYINSDVYHRQLLRLMQGSKVSAISKKNLQKTNVSFPKIIEEQQRIGNFFKILDDLIALHQLKIDKLKEIKKWLMQNMFV